MCDISLLCSRTSSFVKIVRDDGSRISKMLDECSRMVEIIREHALTMYHVECAPLDVQFMRVFPDAKQLLLVKMKRIVESELNKLNKKIDEGTSFCARLQEDCRRIEECAGQIDWNDYREFVTPFSTVITWCEKHCNYYTDIFANVKWGIAMFSMDSKHSLSHLEDLKLSTKDLDYLCPPQVLQMYDLLLIDIKTRERAT